MHSDQPEVAVSMRAELQLLVLSLLARQPDGTVALFSATAPSLASAVGSPGLVSVLLSSGLGSNKADPNQLWWDEGGSMTMAMAVAVECDWDTLGALYRGGADLSTLRGGSEGETVQELVERTTQKTLFEHGVPDEEVGRQWGAKVVFW